MGVRSAAAAGAGERGEKMERRGLPEVVVVVVGGARGTNGCACVRGRRAEGVARENGARTVPGHGLSNSDFLPHPRGHL